MAEKPASKPASPEPEPNPNAGLLAALRAGERVVCAMSPYAGNLVDYAPRSKDDPKPWVLAGWGGRRDDWHRYTAGECRVVQP
jgi:hypothetical protein